MKAVLISRNDLYKKVNNYNIIDIDNMLFDELPIYLKAYNNNELYLELYDKDSFDSNSLLLKYDNMLKSFTMFRGGDSLPNLDLKSMNEYVNEFLIRSIKFDNIDLSRMKLNKLKNELEYEVDFSAFINLSNLNCTKNIELSKENLLIEYTSCNSKVIRIKLVNINEDRVIIDRYNDKNYSEIPNIRVLLGIYFGINSNKILFKNFYKYDH